MTKASRQARPTGLDSIDPARNFTVSVDERIRALAIGPPAYALRKRRIEDTEARWVDTLVELHEKMSDAGCAPGEIDRALRTRAEGFDYARLNALVAAHNRWYPIEANLRIDPRSGGHLGAGGLPWSPERDYTSERILTQALLLIR